MNRLAEETSPYLQQHAGNPVDWFPWGEEALARARDEDRPILLSIGYAACHWCHVMEHESFEDALTARVMNERFVSIKVDREERPDLDSVYMDAVVSLTGQGGWPMTIFLTPAGEPFFGGTYFPPEPRHGLPSFKQVLLSVAEAWDEQRGEVERSAAQLAEHIRSGARLQPSPEPLGNDLLAPGAEQPARRFRSPVGRLGPQTEVPARAGARVPASPRRGGDDAPHARLDDPRRHVGRRRRRLSPLLRRRALARAALREDALRQRAARLGVSPRGAPVRGRPLPAVADLTIDYVLRELALEGGGFASAQDADTDGVEGLTFTWAPGEGAPEELLEPFEHGRFVLRGALDDETRERLHALREQRPKPLRDDKAIASWNGLMLAALAQGGRVGPATDLAGFLLGGLSTPDGRLHRTWRNGVAKGTGYLEDYADVAYGLIELHVASGDPRWLLEAHRLATLAVDLFADDEAGGFFQTPRDGEQLVARKKELDDHPTPSGNAMLAYVLLRLARIWGDDELERRGVSVLRLVRDSLTRAPSAFGWGLVALDQHLAPHRELAIVGSVDAPVARAALEAAASTDVIAFGPAGDIPLLAGRTAVDGRTAVYVCERFTCALPVTDPAEL